MKSSSSARPFIDRLGREYHRPVGKPRALTPTQEMEVVAWWKARAALGNNKSKAAELGVNVSTISTIIRRARKRRPSSP